LPSIEFLATLAVIAAGYTVLGVTGFGSALLIVPVLAHWLPLAEVVPAILLLDVFACVLLGALSFRSVAWRELAALVPGMLAGAAVGVILPSHVPAILLFALRGLLLARLPVLATRRLAAPAGLAAGMIETLFGVAGPVVVMYLGGRLGDPAVMRPTIAVAIVAASTTALVAIGTHSPMPSGDWIALLGAGAAIVPVALWAGGRIARRLRPAAVVRLIHLLLLASGGSLLARALAM
jgi:uncharacterized membrane protein YfcA